MLVSLLGAEPSLEVEGEAADGHDAVALARRLHPDVVVMDVRMPVMGGIEATRLILSEFPETMAIGISAIADEGFRSGMLDAGGVDLLDKKDGSGQLPGMIARHVDRRGK